mgnify:CR=1 FL=1|tara:strand:- start:61 stop:636 length:576 start_codon:yes stop_codon:yes gene_type:complete
MKSIVTLFLFIPFFTWGLTFKNGNQTNNQSSGTITNFSSSHNCSLPYELPTGEIITQNDINEIKMQVQMGLRDMGISKQELKELIINEFKQGSLFSSGSGIVYDDFVKQCKEYGPIEYNRLNKCSAKWLNQILSMNINYEGLNLPVCTLSLSETYDPNNTSNGDTFIDMCKNSKLSELDKDVALLCLEKMN